MVTNRAIGGEHAAMAAQRTSGKGLVPKSLDRSYRSLVQHAGSRSQPAELHRIRPAGLARHCERPST